jgi:DNA-binding SARP family transcriptional activator
VEYRILGPLAVLAGGRELSLGGPKQRRVLALLLLRAGRSVEVDELAEAVWGADVPATGRRQVQNAIGVLRSKLIKAGGVIDNTGAGYVVRAGRNELDALVFDRMVTEARAAGDAKLMREALALWHGPALAGLVDGELLAQETARLEERRLAALEDCVDLELAAGQHESAIVELSELVAANPLRERLVGQLMTALHRCGRADEAEAVYAELSARLADELGIDPSPEVRRVYESIRSPEPVAGAVPPAQLPADVSAFAGRAGELGRLDRVLMDRPANGTVVISAIAGTAGVGKTALAVHWAHRVRARFPDGQLHVNLRG